MADETDSNITAYELTATRTSPNRTRVDTGDAEFVVGHDVNPIEYFLGAVVACLNSTATMVARDMDVDIESLDATVRGTVDYSRYLGEPSENRPGLRDITVSLDVESDADAATMATWLDSVEARCPVTDNVANESSLDVVLGD
jgi:uncharacterized OsmC-like protein